MVDHYHMEALICEVSCLVSRGGIYPGALVVLLCDLLDPHDGVLQLLVHCSVKDRMSDIVTQIEGANEQDVNAGHLCNGVKLSMVSLGLRREVDEAACVHSAAPLSSRFERSSASHRWLVEGTLSVRCLQTSPS